MRAAAHRLLRHTCAASFCDSSASVAALPGGVYSSAALLGPLLARLSTDMGGTATDGPASLQADDNARQEAGAAGAAAFRFPPDETPELGQMVADFSSRLFASSLGDEEEQQSDAPNAAAESDLDEEETQPDGAAEPAAELCAAGAHSSDTDAPLADLAADILLSPSKKLSIADRRRAEWLAKKERPDYEGWLAAHADAAAALREAAEKMGVHPDPLLVHIYASRSYHHLLQAKQDPGGGHDDGTGATHLAAIDALEAAAALLSTLGIAAEAQPRLLQACPQLLTRRPAEATLAALQELFGGRAQLAEAVARCPAVLTSTVPRLRRRLDLLVLQLQCSPDAAAAAAARHPALLLQSEKRIKDSARFLGHLLPARPYRTLVQRFPDLLAAPLEQTLRALRRAAPADLAALDLQLLTSQQPTLLLQPAAVTVAAWRELRAAVDAIPAWRDEWEVLTQPIINSAGPTKTRGRRLQALPESDPLFRAWYAALLDGGGDDGMAELPAAAAGASSRLWADQVPESAAIAAQPGAYGSRQRPWGDGERLRARVVARLLSARRWQRQRLAFLAAHHPEEAESRRLLDVVVAPIADFRRHFPEFGDWMDEQRAEAAAAAEARRAARLAARDSEPDGGAVGEVRAGAEEDVNGL